MRYTCQFEKLPKQSRYTIYSTTRHERRHERATRARERHAEGRDSSRRGGPSQSSLFAAARRAAATTEMLTAMQRGLWGKVSAASATRGARPLSSRVTRTKGDLVAAELWSNPHAAASAAAAATAPTSSTSLTDPRLTTAIHTTHTCFTGHVRSRGEVTYIYEPETLSMPSSAASISYPSTYIEVRTRDIGRKEDLSVLVTDTGSSLSCSQIWVKKGSLVHRVEPFRA